MGPAAADPRGGPARRLAARSGDRTVRHRCRRCLATGRLPGPDLHRRRRWPAGGDGPYALGGLRSSARGRRTAPAHRRGTFRRRRGALVGRDRPLLPGPPARRLVAGTDARYDAGQLPLVRQGRSLPLPTGPAAPVAALEPDRGHRVGPAPNRLAAILIGPPIPS